jgi:hypothetical protein
MCAYVQSAARLGRILALFGTSSITVNELRIAMAAATISVNSDARQPAYLFVPPGYERNWRLHCGQYHAYGRPVHFVRDKWYQGI